MSTLYELKGQLLQLLSIADDPETDPQVFADTLEGLEGELEEKAEGYARVMAQLDCEIAGIDSQIARLTKVKKAISSNKAKMMDSLEQAMRETGKLDFKTELFRFHFRKNPASLVLADAIDMGNVPAEYIKWGEPTIDKTAVKDAIKNGQVFDWAHLENKQTLRID